MVLTDTFRSTGIFIRKYSTPHPNRASTPNGIPLDSLKRFEFLKSRKSIEIKIRPVRIKAMEAIVGTVKTSSKKITDKITVTDIEEFATGVTAPTFPLLIPMENNRSGK